MQANYLVKVKLKYSNASPRHLTDHDHSVWPNRDFSGFSSVSLIISTASSLVLFSR